MLTLSRERSRLIRLGDSGFSNKRRCDMNNELLEKFERLTDEQKEFILNLIERCLSDQIPISFELP